MCSRAVCATAHKESAGTSENSVNTKFGEPAFSEGGVQRGVGAGNTRRGKERNPGREPCPVHTLANTDESSMNR